MKKGSLLLLLFLNGVIISSVAAEVDDSTGAGAGKGSNIGAIIFVLCMIGFVILVRKLYDKRTQMANKNQDAKPGKHKDNIYEPRYWYQCKNCKVTIRKDSMPRSEDCFKAPDHAWTELAEVGTIKYLCKSCNTLIETRTVPVTDNCPDSPAHTWERLAR